MQPNLKKGNLVEVRGRENVRLFTNKNNEPQIGRDIFADAVEWIPVGTSGGTGTQDTAFAKAVTPTEAPDCGTLKQPEPTPVTATAAAVDIDDLPF